MDYFQIIYLFLLGSIFGSFLNVVIYRLPQGLSVIKPASHCISCNHIIKWYENIPIISFIILKGKCSNCNENISILYPAVEMITGLLFVILAVYSDGLFQYVFFIIHTFKTNNGYYRSFSDAISIFAMHHALCTLQRTS